MSKKTTTIAIYPADREKVLKTQAPGQSIADCVNAFVLSKTPKKPEKPANFANDFSTEKVVLKFNNFEDVRVLIDKETPFSVEDKEKMVAITRSNEQLLIQKTELEDKLSLLQPQKDTVKQTEEKEAGKLDFALPKRTVTLTPTPEVIAAMCHSLKCKPEDLFTGADWQAKWQTMQTESILFMCNNSVLYLEQKGLKDKK